MTIKWKTRAGSLGIVKEGGPSTTDTVDHYEFILNAVDTDGIPLTYELLSGATPPGMYVTQDGRVMGIPTITTATAKNGRIFSFTVRASNGIGTIADRTFSLNVTKQSGITIFPRNLYLGAFDDGSKLSYQFYATMSDPNAQIKWSIVSGRPPIDVFTNKPMTLSSDGLLTGYVARLIDTAGGTPGFDVETSDDYPYEFTATSQDNTYSFKIQATDGYSVDTLPVTIKIVSKEHWTADNSITIINNTTLGVDADNHYSPIILTDPSSIPTLQAGNKFAFKFDAYDPEGQAFLWDTIGTVPNGLSLSRITGWLTGTLPTQTEEEKTYTFSVQAYKRDNTSVRSVPVEVNITTLRDSTNYITWTSPASLGTIVNGTVSEFNISAVSNLQKSIVYSKLDSPSSRLPQGLKLLPSGDISGRATFQYFSLDGDTSSIQLESTTGITTGMTVEGPGVASGSNVLAVINSNTVKVGPAIYITEGTEITFSDLLTSTEIITRTTSLSTTTSIDKNKTTFDCTFKFTAKAATTDGTSSSTREFTILVDNYNRAPYENLYLKALTSVDQRQLFNSIVNNEDIFPSNLIYRPTDPWFGKSSDMKMLFLPGLTASALSEFANAIANNHYNKKINFGKVKTARAVDENFNTKYEVVYLEVVDNNAGAALIEQPNITNYYLYEGESYYSIYPNNFTNMTYRVASGIGYSNRGALPNWMTSPQDDGRVLGLTRGIVLAYTIPGASKLIAYRLENNNINFNNINFIADRYQLDGSLSDNYNTATNRFYTSKEATFDVLANVNDIDLYTGDVAVDVDLSTTITLSEEPAIGFGWRISEKQVNTLSNIPEGTTVVSVDGNVVTVNKPVTLSTGDQILFDGTASATYAVSVPFDSINGRFRAQVPFIDGVKTYEAGETILFIQQELYDGYTGTNDGWTRVKDWLMADGLDVDLYDDYEIIPGFAEKALDPTVVNQRAGIWQISFDSDGIVLLNCIQEIILTQVVQIASGTSHAGTFMMYDENPKPGFTVPAYSPQDALQSSSTDRTRFDGSNTRFYDHRDNYAEPETGDKYIKFTQFGVYK